MNFTIKTGQGVFAVKVMQDSDNVRRWLVDFVSESGDTFGTVVYADEFKENERAAVTTAIKRFLERSK